MKKFIYMILLMGIMFIGANNVGAKTQKFVCDYSADFTSQSGKVVKFSVYVYDDNSVSVSSFDNVNGTDLTARQNMFTEMKFNEHFLSKATEGGNNCPDLGLQTDGLNASITVIRSATEQGVTVMPGTFVEGAGTASETKKETICTREQEMRNNKNINVEFYTIGTSRYWNISYAEGSGSTTGLIAEMITLDGMTFNIGEDVVKNIYDSKNCSSLIYFECPNQATINLTTTKPSDSENCSYSVTTAKNDTGLGVSTSKTTTTVKNPTSSYSSTSTKQCINCNNTYIPYSLSVLSRNIINLVQLLVPVIIIITGMIELLRAVIAGDEKKMDEVKPTLIRKIIAGVIIFLIFAIVKFGFSFLGSRANATLKCVSYFISEEGNEVNCPERAINELQGSAKSEQEYYNFSTNCAKYTNSYDCENGYKCKWKYNGTSLGCFYTGDAPASTTKECWTNGNEYRWQVSAPGNEWGRDTSKTNEQDCNYTANLRCWKNGDEYRWQVSAPGNYWSEDSSKTSEYYCLHSSNMKCWKNGSSYRWQVSSPGNYWSEDSSKTTQDACK